jgi:hypothetical protein
MKTDTHTRACVIMSGLIILRTNHATDKSVQKIKCVVRKRSLRRADHSSRGVLPTVVRRVCDLKTSRIGAPYIYDISKA